MFLETLFQKDLYCEQNKIRVIFGIFSTLPLNHAILKLLPLDLCTENQNHGAHSPSLVTRDFNFQPHHGQHDQHRIMESF